MSNDSLNAFMDALLAQTLSKNFTRGSLWWVSEAMWRNMDHETGAPFRSNRASHPGAIIMESSKPERRLIRILPGTTPKLPIPVNGNEVIMRMMPREQPEKWTKFGGRDTFIGQMSMKDFLAHDLKRSQGPPADGELSVERNREVPSLDPNDLAKLCKSHPF